MNNKKNMEAKIRKRKNIRHKNNFTIKDYFPTDYYKAYDKRYKQVYENKMLWSSKENTSDVINAINKYHISTQSKILDLGCGEGRDAIYLLNKGYDVLGIDYSDTVIKKCNELSSYQFQENFKQFDLIVDKLNEKYNFIYSIAVLHMFVISSHRKKYFNFIKEHLENDGLALICVLGDGIKNSSSDYTKAFENTKRIVMNNNKELEIATTSCKIVDWETLEKEIKTSGLKIKERWISNSIPEFSESMCVVVSQE